jgi:hypothetical protein
LQAGSHWNAIAEHAAASLMESLRLGKGCIAPQLECERIYVRGPTQASDFAQAFRTQFITSLVKSGVTVARNPSGAIEVDFDIQVVAGPIPQHEVIVTVSASDATRYLGRTTNVYYVATPTRCCTRRGRHQS